MRITVEIGERFGKWIVLNEVEPYGSGRLIRRRFLCRCSCGTERIIDLQTLRNGSSRGCKECRVYPTGRNPLKTMKCRTYRIYWGMRERCYHEKCFAYDRYGGRGITVCDRWMENYDNFVADMGAAPPRMTLDRINNDGPYSPDNCRWADRTMQANNRRSSRIVSYGGHDMTLAEAARVAGVDYKKLHERMARKGLSLEAAISELRLGSLQNGRSVLPHHVGEPEGQRHLMDA